ncbi:hypothetical protein TB2_047211 [Malus domestica]
MQWLNTFLLLALFANTAKLDEIARSRNTKRKLHDERVFGGSVLPSLSVSNLRRHHKCATSFSLLPFSYQVSLTLTSTP